MKKILILGLLAALAGGSSRATTVTFSTAAGPQASITQGSIVATGHYYNENSVPFTWMTGVVQTDDTYGIGTRSITTSVPVQGSLNEYIMFDFGAGTTTVSSIELYLTALSGTPTTYFTYAWVAGAPVGAGGGSVPLPPLTPFTIAPLVGTGATNTFSSFGPIPSSGRYLLLGATNHNAGPESTFYVRTITYTTVPDGASTLALMGAAIATLGLAARRRKE